MIRQCAFEGDRKLLKGGLHCHTTRSDGWCDPEDVMAKHKENGYLVEEQTAEAFAEGIHWALTEGQKKDRMLLRKSVEEHFSEEAVTRQFLDLYNR